MFLYGWCWDPIVLNATPEGFQLCIPLPNDPALDGIDMVMQALLQPASLSEQIRISHAVRFTFGE